MSDLWPFSSPSPPIMHHSPLPQPPPHPQLTSPHLLPPPHQLLFTPDPDLDPQNWTPCEPSELCGLLGGDTFSFQNQTSAHLDLQNQTQFGGGATHHRAYGAHFEHGTPPCLGLDPWGPLEQAPPPLRWSSEEFAEDFPSAQFFHNSYHDNSAPQPFCSPTTPGPSPHYPQTPAVCGPGPERSGFHAQTSPQLSRGQTFICRPTESDPGQHHRHQTSLLQSEPVHDPTGLLGAAAGSQNGFSSQGRGRDVSRTGLSWTEEGGGGGGGRGAGQPDWTRMKQATPERSTDVLDSRLLCLVCQRDFRSLPALNGHMRSHSGFRSAPRLKKDSSPPVKRSVSVVIPVSVPVQSPGVLKACGSGQRRRGASGGGALYRSLMHLEEEEEEDGAVTRGGGHYTPPPMLCPLRAGPGLYRSLTTGGQHRAQTVQLRNGFGDLVAMETLMTGIVQPRINVGRGFQAQIPPLRDRKRARSDSHHALLLWTPWDGLERPVNHQRVEALLMMARSSAVPGGGASPEHTLHVLSESRGDFLLTAEKLLSTPRTSNTQPGVGWSAAERRQLVKSLQLHHKDFSSAQKAVQTKTLSECVEFYYLWKKKLRLSTRTPTGLTVTLPNANGRNTSSLS